MSDHHGETSQVATKVPDHNAEAVHPVVQLQVDQPQASSVSVNSPRVAVLVDKPPVPQPPLPLHLSLRLLHSQLPPEPRSYTTWSIVNILCCCLPLGITALAYSVRVRRDYEAGLFSEAQNKSSRACSLNVVATVLGSVIILAVIGSLCGTLIT